MSARASLYRARRALDHLVFPGARAIILLYHRVTDEVSDPYGLCVQPAHFEQHLETIRALGQPVSLPELARSLRNGGPPERAICLTFDDGYLDNLEHAVPLLEKYDIPANVFVTTGDGGREFEFWWDELERIFLQPGVLPDRLELEIDGEECAWDLADGRSYTAEDQRRCRGWHLHDTDAPTRRHAIFRDVYFRVRPLRVERRAAIMERLVAWAGLRSGFLRPTHAVMRPEQVAALVGRGLVTVGAHTMDHPDLPSQDAQTQLEEIRTSKQILEEWIGAAVPGFAYPYGLYDDDSVGAVRTCGFDFACAGDHRLVRRGADLMLLPRIDVPVGDAGAVARLLHRWYW